MPFPFPFPQDLPLHLGFALLFALERKLVPLAAGEDLVGGFFTDFRVDFFFLDGGFDLRVTLPVGFMFFRAMTLPFDFLPSPCAFFSFPNFASRDWIRRLRSFVETSSRISPLRVGRLAGRSASTTAAMRSAADKRHGSTVAFEIRCSCSLCLICAWKCWRGMMIPSYTSLRRPSRTMIRLPITVGLVSLASTIARSPRGFVCSSRMAVSISAQRREEART